VLYIGDIVYVESWLIHSTIQDEELTDDDMAFLHHFSLKVSAHLTNKVNYEMVCYACLDLIVASFKVTHSWAAFLTAYKPVSYDCCLNSRCCFVGPHKYAKRCAYCNKAHHDESGCLCKAFTYSPIIPQLVTLYKNEAYMESVQYQVKYKSDPNKVCDIFNSTSYCEQKKEHVLIDRKCYPHKFFGDPRDISLGLSTDGFAPFHCYKNTCWPIILFNYNLPPDIQFHLAYTLCVSIILGPKKPKDFGLFVWPLIEELLQLKLSVSL
jgi:hypothetical protein